MSENKHTVDQSKILTAEQEAELVKPIDEHIAEIQKKIDALRADGEEKIVTLKNQVQLAKENKALNKQERANIISEAEAEIAKAKEVEARIR
jgi:methyl-galactoside transport system permease protein